MKKATVLIAIIVICIFSLMFFRGQSEKKAFKTAIRKSETISYQRFLQSYPRGKYADTVKARIQQIEMEETAFKEDTIESYKELLRQYPESKQSNYALNRIEYLNRFKNLNVPMTLKISIESLEGDWKSLGNKLTIDLQNIFNCVGVKVVKGNDDKPESKLLIKAKSSAYGATYRPENYVGSSKFLYTGASVSGKIVFKADNKIIEKSFSGSTDTPKKIVGTSVFDSKSEAPFRAAYSNSDLMLQVLEIVDEVYGLESLAQCFVGLDNRYVEEAIFNKGRPLVDYLLDYLNDGNLWRVSIVVKVLGKIGDTKATEPLVRLLQDEELYVSENDVAKAREYSSHKAAHKLPLGQVITQDPILYPKVSLRKTIVRALGALSDKRAFDALVNCFKNEKELVRLDAIDALGGIADRRAVELLIPALSDKNESIRRRAAEALGMIGDGRAFKPLVDSLQRDENEFVRGGAAKGLGYMGDHRAVEFLVSALEDENNVKRNAAEALSLITKKSFIGVWGDIKEQNINEWKEWWMKNKESYSLNR